MLIALPLALIPPRPARIEPVRALAFLKFLRHSRLNDLSIRQHHGEKQVLGWPTSRICKANEPMRKRLFIKFRILKTARLQVVKRCHPIRRDPDGLLSGDGVRRGLRTRFKHVLKFPTVLCRERVAEQFSRIRENRHQKTAKNWGDERDENDSKSESHRLFYPLGEPKELYSADSTQSASSSSSSS